jgi:hypothetical protein
VALVGLQGPTADQHNRLARESLERHIREAEEAGDQERADLLRQAGIDGRHLPKPTERDTLNAAIRRGARNDADEDVSRAVRRLTRSPEA